MKRTLLINSKLFIILSMVIGTLSSCLKDKGYENGEYGMPNTEGQAFISIPKAVNKPNGLGLESKDAIQDVKLFAASFDFVNPAPSDITVTLELNNALVTAMDPTIEVLPASVYTIPSLTLTIPAGKRLSEELLLKLNTNTLDPQKRHGIGFSIKSVSNGATIPANLKNVVYAFAIKNKYDGVYRLKGYHNRVPYNFPYDTEIHLVTKAPNEVYFYWPEVKSTGHPIGVGANNAMSWYGSAVSPSIIFDPVTNKVTSVYNLSTAVVITMFTGPGSRESKYDPATKKITVDFNYSNRADRAFFDDLEYIKARP